MVQVNFNVWGSTSINRSGTINRSLPTYVIVHGYQSTGGNASNGFKPADWMANIAQTLRRRESTANIILVDWEAAASSFWYPTAAGNTREVGRQVSNYLRNLGVDANSVQLIGHSLGAHVAGFAGSSYRQATGRSLGHIVGLDPAGPEFEGKGTGDRLDPSDAQRVTAIHTSETLGYDDRLATYDIYANWNDLLQPGQSTFVGNHSYAHTLYTELLQGNSFRQSNGSVLNLNATVNAGFAGQNNASTRNNRSITALSFTGTSGNDVIAGGAGADSLSGGAGNDRISAGDGNDWVSGGSGSDLLNGGRGNDSIFGGTGNDILIGDDGDDYLVGADMVAGQGRSEVDVLTGGAGRDRFVLGMGSSIFYTDGVSTAAGVGDYALITDFNATQDVIQLGGSKSNYLLGASPTGAPSGIAVFLRDAVPELVAIIQGSTGLSLNASYFVTA
jgi:hypothetical protein